MPPKIGIDLRRKLCSEFEALSLARHVWRAARNGPFVNYFEPFTVNSGVSR
jgi:hypothetical protein